MHTERNDALKDNNKLAIQRYNFAVKCLKNRKLLVVDCACGMGYGYDLLRQAGHYLIGIDNSQEAIDYAMDNYPGDYFCLDIENIEPLDDYDVTVCLETICHLKNPQEFINKIKTKELIISAPIDPDPNDGYKYRLHNLSEIQFKELLKDWKIIDEMWQGKKQKYLTIYCKKI